MANFKEYTILTDTLNGVLDSDTLKVAIQNSVITVAFNSISTASGVATITFNATLAGNDITILDGIVSSHTGTPVIINEPKYDLFGSQLVASSGNAGLKETSVSFNWCDKTTWYQNSIRVTDEVLLDSGNHIVYNLTTPKIIIDVTHWKISDETCNVAIIACKAIVKVNGVTKIEAYYVGNTLQNADYTVNYTTGQVTFTSTLDVADVVTMTYNKLPVTDTGNEYGMRQSCWSVKAPVNCRVFLNRAEVQFSDDVHLFDSIRFVPFTTVGLDPLVSFLMSAPYYYPSGTEIPFSMLNPELEKRFNTIDDFIDDADGYYYVPETVATGRTIRDLPIGKRVYKWTYQGNENMELNSELGRFIKIFLMNDVCFEGSKATATLYGTKFKL